MIRHLQGIPIEIGPLANSALPELLSLYADRRIVIMVDENTHANCLDMLLNEFPVLDRSEIMMLPAGEENKTIEIVYQVWSALLEYRVQRQDLIINLGGGLVTDVGGFIAATYKRGIAFIHIPTSLLGMVDAALGAKTGIDVNQIKNAVGTFTPPKGVYIDPIFLETLPGDELLNGFAEMLKHALIIDATYWHQLKSIRNDKDLTTEENILRAIEIKVEVVSSDPLESGQRKLLNFGHTIGHGIESYFLSKKPIHHGHAVALGMIAESYISHKRNVLPAAQYLEIEQTIISLFPMPPIPEHAFQEIIELLRNDKKNAGDHIYFVLLQEIGSAEIDSKLTEREIGEALLHLTMLAKNAN